MTSKEEAENPEKFLTSETEKNPVEMEEKENTNLENDDDDFKGYSKCSKFLLFFLFFWIGIINHLGTVLVLNGGRLLGFELGMVQYLQLYSSASTIFAILTRFINSKLCIKISYKKRIYFLCLWFMLGYLSMYAVLELHDSVLEGYNALCFILSFIPCFFLGSSYAFGEGAMIAYLRLFPKTLIAGWSSGTGLSGFLSGGLNLMSQLIDGFSLKYLYLVLFPVGLVYLFLFLWTFKLLKVQERKVQREERLSRPNLAIIRDSSVNASRSEKENKEEDENLDYPKDGKMEAEPEAEQSKEEIKESEAKDLEEMNKTNKVMSFENFKRVMSMAGRVIINLGLIYFLQFFCVNTLIVSVCDQKDIDFLPLGCSDEGAVYRRGKFEFINLAYQTGMFLSKTFIKIVRKIQPIEVYTVVIALINVLYIIEKIMNKIPWGFYIPFGLVLGFFGGGTYSGGFYTILNSGQVEQNYKELTVNVATIFNDAGTFLSGISGWAIYKYVLDANYPNLTAFKNCTEA